MKVLAVVLGMLTSLPVFAADCGIQSGTFKTTDSECLISADGSEFFPDEHRGLILNYSKVTKALQVDMVYGENHLELKYIVDGREHPGHPDREGTTYTATCVGNKLRIKPNADGNNMNTEYTFESATKLDYRESFESRSFIRVCKMKKQPG